MKMRGSVWFPQYSVGLFLKILSCNRKFKNKLDGMIVYINLVDLLFKEKNFLPVP